MRQILIALLLLTAAAAQAAGGYRIVHPDGTVEFTDQPAKGAQEVDIPAPQTYAPPPVPQLSTPTAPEEPPAAKPASYKTVRVVTPAHDSTVQANDGKLSVAVLVEPQLLPNHRVALSLDGKRVAKGGGVFTLEGVERGTHTLEATIIDETGRTLLSSSASTVHVQHHFIQPKGRNMPQGSAR